MANGTDNPDLRIAQSIAPLHIDKIAEKLYLAPEDIEHYGKFKAKIPTTFIDEEKIKNSNLIWICFLVISSTSHVKLWADGLKSVDSGSFTSFGTTYNSNSDSFKKLKFLNIVISIS